MTEEEAGPLLTGVADFLKSGQRAVWGEPMPSLCHSLRTSSPGPMCPLKELKEGGGALPAVAGLQIKDCLTKVNPYKPGDVLQGSSAVRGDADQLEDGATGASWHSGRSDGKSCTGKGRTSCLSTDRGLNYATILEPLNLLWADVPAGAGSALGRGMEGGRTGLIFLAKETGLW